MSKGARTRGFASLAFANFAFFDVRVRLCALTEIASTHFSSWFYITRMVVPVHLLNATRCYMHFLVVALQFEVLRQRFRK